MWTNISKRERVALSRNNPSVWNWKSVAEGCNMAVVTTSQWSSVAQMVIQKCSCPVAGRSLKQEHAYTGHAWRLWQAPNSSG
jgi:hypothetical protein